MQLSAIDNIIRIHYHNVDGTDSCSACGKVSVVTFVVIEELVMYTDPSCHSCNHDARWDQSYLARMGLV